MLDLLYVSDIKEIRDYHKSKLTKQELKMLEKIHIYGLVELSKHKLIREFNILPSLKLFASSCHINGPLTFRAAFDVLMKGLFVRVNRPLNLKYVNETSISTD